MSTRSNSLIASSTGRSGESDGTSRHETKRHQQNRKHKKDKINNSNNSNSNESLSNSSTFVPVISNEEITKLYHKTQCGDKFSCDELKQLSEMKMETIIIPLQPLIMHYCNTQEMFHY